MTYFVARRFGGSCQKTKAQPRAFPSHKTTGGGQPSVARIRSEGPLAVAFSIGDDEPKHVRVSDLRSPTGVEPDVHRGSKIRIGMRIGRERIRQIEVEVVSPVPHHECGRVI